MKTENKTINISLIDGKLNFKAENMSSFEIIGMLLYYVDLLKNKQFEIDKKTKP